MKFSHRKLVYFFVLYALSITHHIMKHLISQEKNPDYETSLLKIAQDILVMPASSVPSERMFSLSGILSMGRMGLISPTNLEKCVRVKANPYLNYFV